MKSWAIFSLVLLFCYSVFAEEKFFKDKLGDNYLISYEQSGKWILEHILIRKDKLQERIGRNVFNSKLELKRFEDQNFALYLKLKSKPDRSQYLTTEVAAEVWEATEQWNLDWEIKFSDWVKAEFNKDFFVKYNLETDCADVAFALRWIFARNHGLPAANTMAGSHVIFSHESMKAEWAKLPRHKDWDKDELFLAALKYLLRQAYTGTLNIDGYPIEMTKESFLVGTIHLDGGHTMIISEIDYQSNDRAPIWKLSSTIPAAVRELNLEMMLDSSMTSEEYGGLFRMRWPSKIQGQWELVPREQMPYYSKEQYSDEFLGEEGQFTLALIKRLGIPFHPKSIVKEAANTTLDYLKTRVAIVEDGFKYCLVNDCNEGSSNYEEYSTPTRDNRLYSKFLAVDDLVNNLSNFDESLPDFWRDFKATNTFSVLNVSKTLADYELIFKYGFASSHPEDTLEERWGISAEFIRSSIEKKIVRALDKRKMIVQNAQVCVGQDSLCKRGTTHWQQFNTFELDSELKTKVYGGYLNFCEVYKNCNYFKNTHYFSDLKGIPFYISEPSATLNAKWGRHENNIDYAIIPEGKEIVQLNDKYFMIDSKLYNVDSENFESADLEDVVAINYMIRSDIFVTFFSKSIEWQDLKNGKKSSLHIAEEIQDVHWYNDNRFSVKGCLDLERRTDCVARYYHLLDTNEIVETDSEILENSDYLGGIEKRIGLLESDYENILFSTSYLYQTEEYVYKIEYFMGDKLYKHEIKSPSGYSKLGASVDYVIYGSDSEIYSFSKLNKQICRINFSADSSFEFVSPDRVLVNNPEETTELVELKSGCQVSSLLKSTNWLEYIKSEPMSLAVEHENFKYYKILSGVVTSKKFPTSYSWAHFEKSSVLWIKNSDGGISDAYWEDLISGQVTKVEPLYLPMSCSKAGLSVCYGHLDNRTLDIYALWDNDSTVLYSQFKNKLGDPILTSFIKTNLNDGYFSDEEINVRKGTFFKLYRDRYIYLKP